MNKENLGVFLAIATAIFSGVAIPANKVFVVNMDPALFTALRAIIIGVIFLVLAWQASKKNTAKTRKKFAVSWKYLAGIAVIGGAFAFLLFFTGLKLTTAGRAAFLHKTLPLYVAVFAFIFLKEKITKKYMYALLLMVIGTVAIYATTINPAELWMNPQLGDMLVISAAVLWAAENIIAKKAMVNGETNFVVSFARMFFGGLILFGIFLLAGKTDALFSITSQQMTNIMISTFLLFAYVFFYYWSLKLINVSKAAAFLLIAPVVSLVLGMIFLNEPAPFMQIVGSTIILLGAYLVIGTKSEQRTI